MTIYLSRIWGDLPGFGSDDSTLRRIYSEPEAPDEYQDELYYGSSFS